LYYCSQYAKSQALPSDLRRVCRDNAQWLIEDRAAVDFGMPGLHFGEAGVLLALCEAREAGVTEFADSDVAHLWRAILAGPIEWLDFTHGAAGITLALATLAARRVRPPPGVTLTDEIGKRLTRIVQGQNADGSWTTPAGVEGMSGEALTGFAHGTAGIAYVLATLSLQRTDVLDGALRAVKWLWANRLTMSTGALAFPYGDGHPEPWTWWCHGAPGVSSLMLALWRATGDERYKASAVRCLDGLPQFFNPANLSLCHGAAGIGELLLDAARITGDSRLAARARGIAEVIQARHACGRRDLYWNVEDPEFVSADLMVGMSGVLHFFLRLVHPERDLYFPTLGVPATFAH
jgi:lantibiotic modifying enzyme